MHRVHAFDLGQNIPAAPLLLWLWTMILSPTDIASSTAAHGVEAEQSTAFPMPESVPSTWSSRLLHYETIHIAWRSKPNFANSPLLFLLVRRYEGKSPLKIVTLHHAHQAIAVTVPPLAA
jgi:hypothetical protein